MEELLPLICDSIEIVVPLVCILLIIKIINGILNICDYIQMKKSAFDMAEEFGKIADEVLKEDKGKRYKEED